MQISFIEMCLQSNIAIDSIPVLWRIKKLETVGAASQAEGFLHPFSGFLFPIFELGVLV